MSAEKTIIIERSAEDSAELVDRLDQAGIGSIVTDGPHVAGVLEANSVDFVLIPVHHDQPEKDVALGQSLHAHHNLPVLFYTDEPPAKLDSILGEASHDGVITPQMHVPCIELVFRLARRRHDWERSLRDSEQQFRALSDAASALIWVADTSGECIWFNRAWLEFTGRPLHEQVGDGWAESVHPDDRERIVEEYLQAFNARETFCLEYRLARHDGVYRTVRDEGVPRFSAEGEFIGYIGCGMDIHDLVETRQKIHQVAERYELACKAGRTGLWEFNINDQTIWNDQTIRRWFGYDREPVGPETWKNRVHPDDLPMLDGLIEQYLAGELQNHEFLVRCRTNSSEYRWIKMIGSLMGDDGSGAMRILGTCTDVHEQRQAELLIQQERHARDETLQSINEMVTYNDPDLRVRWANRAALTRADKTLDEIRGRYCYELWQGRTEPCEDCPLLEVFQTGLAAQQQRKTPDGRWWSLKATPVTDDRGKVIAAVEVGEDITYQRMVKKQQQELQARQGRIEKLQSLSNLAGGVAHDFNNILAIIQGNAELGLRECDPDSIQAEFLKEILAASKRASTLSRSMLYYSGRGRFLLSQTNLNDLLQKQGQTCPLSPQHTIDYQLDESIPSVHIDAPQLGAAIHNLLENAVEALDERPGTITLRSGTEQLTPETMDNLVPEENLKPGHYVFIEVSDTGPGIDSKIVNSVLFDPFYTTHFTGRGLGLAAVLGIVRGHGGCIRVTSTKDHGTTFRLLLPLEELHPDVSPDAPAETPARTVLVVDDEAGIRKLAGRYIASRNLHVQEVASGTEALRVLTEDQQHHIGAVLLDMSMPEVDGMEVYTRLRKFAPALPVVLTSGYGDNTICDTVLKDPNLRFVAKPFSRQQIVEAIGQFIPES